MFCCNPFKGSIRRKRGDWGEDWRVKVVVVGDERCGKTCLIQRHCHGALPLTYTPTLFDTSTTSSQVNGRKVQMVLQDTAGQEDLDRLRPPFYLHTDVILVCLAADGGEDSWGKVHTVWLPEIRRCCGKHVPVLLVTTKTDLVSSGGDPPLSLPTAHPLDHGHTACDRRSVQQLSVRPLCSSVDNPAFRHPDCADTRDDVTNTHDDVTAKRSSADSGIFGSTESLVPAGGRSEDKHSISFKRRDSQTGKRTSDAGSRDSGRRSVSCGQVEHFPAGCSSSGDGNKPPCVGQNCSSSSSSTHQRGRSLASQMGAVGYFETSALLNQGVDRVFQAALSAAMASKQWRKKYRL